MRVSGLYKQESADDRVSFTRMAVWGLLAVALIAGGTLFFLYERTIASIL